MRQETDGRRAAATVAALVATLAVTAGGLAVAPGVAAAAGLTIGGYVFHDVDADGHRDPGEPGLAGLRVQHLAGAPATTTDADGHYRLDELPNSGRLLLHTGWLRSQCYLPENLNCAAGPGDDNDFPTRNQLFELPLADLTGTEDLNAALLPDWPGPGMAPPEPVAGVTPANPVDVAARLSSAPDTCSPDAYGICEAGDTYERIGQIHNQGTRPLTGVRAKVQVPPGDCLTAITMLDAATSEGVGVMQTRPPAEEFGCDTRVVELIFPGALVPAGAIRLSVRGTVEAGPGTPGCTLTAPSAATCATAAPQGRTLMLGVSHIDQWGDPDSPFCARGDLRGCATGLHDKRREPDEVDPAGHNVDAALGGTTALNLSASYVRVDPGLPIVRAGEEVTVRGWARNEILGPGGAAQPTNQAHEGATMRFFFPAGTVVTGLPAPHNLRDCAQDAADPAGPAKGPGPLAWDAARRDPSGAVSVTCVYNSPLAPHASSIALDVSVRVPADWPAGHPYRSVACAAPVAGQGGETLPVAARPCDLDTWPLLTPTDNDDGLFLLVVPAGEG